MFGKLFSNTAAKERDAALSDLKACQEKLDAANSSVGSLNHLLGDQEKRLASKDKEIERITKLNTAYSDASRGFRNRLDAIVDVAGSYQSQDLAKLTTNKVLKTKLESAQQLIETVLKVAKSEAAS